MGVVNQNMRRRRVLLGVVEPADSGDVFDPGAHTVEQILDHLDQHPDDLSRVLDAEREGKARKSILSLG